MFNFRDLHENFKNTKIAAQKTDQHIDSGTITFKYKATGK